MHASGASFIRAPRFVAKTRTAKDLVPVVHATLRGKRCIRFWRAVDDADKRGAVNEHRYGRSSPVRAADGRDHEVSLLKDRWEQAQEGMGQIVLLIGEPGLGKSRLVESIKQHVAEQAREMPLTPGSEGGARFGDRGVALLAALPQHRAVLGLRVLRAIPRIRTQRIAGGSL
jgi:hypothetical protein